LVGIKLAKLTEPPTQRTPRRLSIANRFRHVEQKLLGEADV
jgi:hypothetical protein